MDDDRTIHIDLELRLQGDEVRGKAVADDAPPHEFRGWLGLIAALDTLLAAPEGEEAGV